MIFGGIKQSFWTWGFLNFPAQRFYLNWSLTLKTKSCNIYIFVMFHDILNTLQNINNVAQTKFLEICGFYTYWAKIQAIDTIEPPIDTIEPLCSFSPWSKFRGGKYLAWPGDRDEMRETKHQCSLIGIFVVNNRTFGGSYESL